MATLDSLFDNAKTVANKAVKKGGAYSEAAALKIKIMNKRRDIAEEYKKLGAFVYKKLKTESPELQDEITEKIGECVETIDRLMLELARYNHDYKAKLDEAKGENSKYSATPEEVMEEFNKAREKAEEEYKEAIILAEEANESLEEAILLAEEAKEIAEDIK